MERRRIGDYSRGKSNRGKYSQYMEERKIQEKYIKSLTLRRMLNSDPLYKTMQARKNQEKELIIANESLESETTKQMHELSEKKKYLHILNF